MIDYTRKRKDVPLDEERNWPEGCVESSHTFKDLAESPIVLRPYYSNEEIFSLYATRRNELKAAEVEPKEAERLAKIELLPIIYPAVDVVNFAVNNQQMTDKCCRLSFLLAPDRIAAIHVVHGEALDFFNVTVGEDLDLSIPDDPKWGWDMTKPKEGFPCINLAINGCPYYITNGKPDRCSKFPFFPEDIHLITTCKYEIEKIGDIYEKKGSCDRCGA